MRIVINITNDSSVSYALLVLDKLKDNDDFRVLAICYTNSIKEKLIKLDVNNLVDKIITQEDIGLPNNNYQLSNKDVLKIEEIESNYSRNSIWNYVNQDRILSYTKRGFLYNNGTSFSRPVLVKTILTHLQVKYT